MGARPGAAGGAIDAGEVGEPSEMLARFRRRLARRGQIQATRSLPRSSGTGRLLPRRCEGAKEEQKGSELTIDTHPRCYLAESILSNFVRLVQTVRWQCEDAGECSGTDGDHHEQAHTKSADGGGQDKGADAKGGADLPDELLAGGRTAHARNRDAVLHHHGERRREKPHDGAGDQRGGDDPAEAVFERDHKQEEPENMNHDSDHARQAFADAMNQSPRGE